MEAMRGCALGRRSARDPGVRQIRVARASERTARGAFAARRAHERAAAHGMGGEAAGRAGRGEWRGRTTEVLALRVAAVGRLFRVTVHSCRCEWTLRVGCCCQFFVPGLV